MGYPEGCPFGLFRQRHRLSPISQKKPGPNVLGRIDIANQLLTVLKAVYVAQERYRSFKCLSHLNLSFHFLGFTAYFNSIFTSVNWILPRLRLLCFGELKLSQQIEKKVNFKSKSSGFKSKSFLNLKFQIDYKVTVVKKYFEYYINVLNLQISFSLGNYELKKNHFGLNKWN